MQDGIILDAASFRMAMRLLEEDDDDTEDATPSSLATEMDDNAEARQIIEALSRLDASTYDRRRLHRALQEDVDALTEIWYDLKDITTTHDTKLQRLKALLATELHGHKVMIFTYFKDTARYLHGVFMSDDHTV